MLIYWRVILASDWRAELPPKSVGNFKVPSWLWIRTIFLLNGVQYYIYTFFQLFLDTVYVYVYIYVDSLTVSSFILYHIPMISHYHSRCSRLIFPLHITQYVFCVSSHPYSSWNSMFPCFQRYFSRGFNMFLLFPPQKIPYLVGGLEHGFYFSIYWE